MPSRTALFASAAIVYGLIAQGAFYRPQAFTLLALAALALFADGWRPAMAAWFDLPRLTRIGIQVTLAAITVAVVMRPSTASILPVTIHSTAVVGSLVGVRIRREGQVGGVMLAMSLAGVLVALLGAIGVAWHREPLALQAQGIWRAASTLTYANAMAAALVPCIAAACWRIRAGIPTGSVELSIMIGGMVATMSRGSALGMAIGVVALAVTTGRDAFAGFGRPLVGGAIIGASALPSVFGEGRPLLLFLGLLLGVGLANSRRSVPLLHGDWRVIGAVAAGVALAVLLLAPSATGQIVDRAVNEDRLQIWDAAWQAARSDPIFGQGLGVFEVFQERYGQLFRIRYAHNELLQALVETGWVGAFGLALGSALGLLGYLTRRTPRGDWGLGIFVVVTFGIHGLTDFIWHISVVGFLTAIWYGIGARPQAGGVQEPSQL